MPKWLNDLLSPRHKARHRRRPNNLLAQWGTPLNLRAIPAAQVQVETLEQKVMLTTFTVTTDDMTVHGLHGALARMQSGDTMIVSAYQINLRKSLGELVVNTSQINIDGDTSYGQPVISAAGSASNILLVQPGMTNVSMLNLVLTGSTGGGSQGLPTDAVITVRHDGDLNMHTVTVTGNSSPNGVIQFNNSSGYLYNCTFANNTAGSSGWAEYWNGSVTSDFCYYNNEPLTVASGYTLIYGTSMVGNTTPLTVTGGHFTSGYTTVQAQGPGQSSVVVTGGTDVFYNDTLSNTVAGAGLNVVPSTAVNLTINTTTFSNNYGGGLILGAGGLSGYMVTVNTSSFTGNGSGAGTANIADYGGNLFLNQVTTTGGNAVLGDLYVSGSGPHVTVTNSVFSANQAGPGIYLDGTNGTGKLTVNTTEVYGEYGAAVFLTGTSGSSFAAKNDDFLGSSTGAAVNNQFVAAANGGSDTYTSNNCVYTTGGDGAFTGTAITTDLGYNADQDTKANATLVGLVAKTDVITTGDFGLGTETVNGVTIYASFSTSILAMAGTPVNAKNGVIGIDNVAYANPGPVGAAGGIIATVSAAASTSGHINDPRWKNAVFFVAADLPHSVAAPVLTPIANHLPLVPIVGHFHPTGVQALSPSPYDRLRRAGF